jgi:hypothetical protein
MAGRVGLLLAILAVHLAEASAADAPAASPAPAAAGKDLPPLISHRPGDVRVLLLTDCAKYQDWQTIAGAYAWRESGQPGGFTRVANCDEKDRKNYPKAMLDYVDTHMAPMVRFTKSLWRPRRLRFRLTAQFRPT